MLFVDLEKNQRYLSIFQRLFALTGTSGYLSGWSYNSRDHFCLYSLSFSVRSFPLCFLRSMLFWRRKCLLWTKIGFLAHHSLFAIFSFSYLELKCIGEVVCERFEDRLLVWPFKTLLRMCFKHSPLIPTPVH